MTIEIRIIKEQGEDVFAPLVICDHCRQPIEDGEAGLYCYDFCHDDGAVVGLKFYHKNRETHPACNWAHYRDKERAESQGYNWYWDTLTAFMTYLGNNVQRRQHEQQ